MRGVKYGDPVDDFIEIVRKSGFHGGLRATDLVRIGLEERFELARGLGARLDERLAVVVVKVLRELEDRAVVLLLEDLGVPFRPRRRETEGLQDLRPERERASRSL